MKLPDLRFSAKLLDCIVKTNGDMDQFNNKLYALFDNETAKRVSPFYSLKEWSKLNEAKVLLDYCKK